VTLASYLGLVAATVIFVWSPLFRRFRDLCPEFLGCAMCMGFWSGFVGSVSLTRHLGLESFLDACVVSVGAWLVYLVGRWLDEH
jgi:hypothetical protein